MYSVWMNYSATLCVCQLQRWSHQSTIFHGSLPTSVAIPQFSVTYTTPMTSSEQSDSAASQRLFQYIAVAYRDGSVKLIDKQTFRPMTTTNLDTGISDFDNNAKRRRSIAYMTYMHQTVTGMYYLILKLKHFHATFSCQCQINMIQYMNAPKRSAN